MRKPVYLLLLLFIPILSIGQSLSPERVAKIKECTVKIIIEGGNSIGTGFITGENGSLVSCWHVIEPAIIRDPITHNISGFKKIFIQRNTGEIEQVGIPVDLINKDYRNALAYDYVLLGLVNKRLLPYKYLKLGDYTKVKEGQEVYTCGYPLGIDQQFISKGIISTKYLDTTIAINEGGNLIKMPRSQMLVDFTLNKGNSGGAVIKIGNTIEEDEVIGIADFIINPIGGKADYLIDNLQKATGALKLQGIDPNEMFLGIIQVLNSSSVGISGAVSINHFLDGLGRMRQ